MFFIFNKEQSQEIEFTFHSGLEKQKVLGRDGLRSALFKCKAPLRSRRQPGARWLRALVLPRGSCSAVSFAFPSLQPDKCWKWGDGREGPGFSSSLSKILSKISKK